MCSSQCLSTSDHVPCATNMCVKHQIRINLPTSGTKMATYNWIEFRKLDFKSQFSRKIGSLNNFSVVWIEDLSDS